MIADRSILIGVTGLQRPSAIRRWLEREKIPYLVGADKWPKVAQSEIDRRLGAQSNTKAEPKLRNWRHA